MVSIWWLPLVFLVGAWAGTVVMAMMNMAGSLSDHAEDVPRAAQLRGTHG